MTTVTDIQTALANEARRTELKTKLANLQGTQDATASIIARLSTLNSDSQQQYNSANAELVALNAGAGPGITADFGPKSNVTQFLETEREAAKTASITFIQGNPACTEAEAAAAWDTAATATNAATINMPVQSGLAMGRLYQLNLYSTGLILAPTWENFRAWVIATPAAIILAI